LLSLSSSQWPYFFRSDSFPFPVQSTTRFSSLHGSHSSESVFPPLFGDFSPPFPQDFSFPFSFEIFHYVSPSGSERSPSECFVLLVMNIPPLAPLSWIFAWFVPCSLTVSAQFPSCFSVTLRRFRPLGDFCARLLRFSFFVTFFNAAWHVFFSPFWFFFSVTALVFG